ncbi:hypothetical protein F383_29062 [Gossypium arboreum]|uniref:Uncharacterized protein n=1 Tax=Gossypium arboreum TaxID=29729 RepID=A0A0B0MVI8_GOSAR|nr:hypothetical protein F383_29062 [Gossypium arboreum]
MYLPFILNYSIQTYLNRIHNSYIHSFLGMPIEPSGIIRIRG